MSVQHTCNCMYGPADPRCCIAKARRRELEEAHRLGREGKPLPPADSPASVPAWPTADQPPRDSEER